MPMAKADGFHNDNGELSSEYVAVRSCWVKQFKFKKGSLEARDCNAKALMHDRNFRRLLRSEGLFRMNRRELDRLIHQVFEDFLENEEVFRWPGETEWSMSSATLNERRRPAAPSKPPRTIKRRPAGRPVPVFVVR